MNQIKIILIFMISLMIGERLFQWTERLGQTEIVYDFESEEEEESDDEELAA